ncbi:hypothetical protein B1F79_02655 [Coxiella-like endosymbiont of Rhipicephalus sanguineus]|uniref:MetQ/NlpA family ABC transporter substrate-binding protein n=1 Tax=Coxiella-like endosymbiont of Rhipicephalus sanguineus TaxID=1955402 RepID=UPI00204084BD|nr:MetQ/NlpA family ABC transporter substrate-binding protein [Coxiella-like endosymbiont of Rhipicephalus sanguineus]MBT8506507.1 hypothetical protein [Coxiella-like endosymbiont of Rhipicephalus sanguineus]
MTIILITTLIILGVAGYHQKEAKDTIRVGTISGPETELMETGKEVALKKYGLHVIIVKFSDYNILK